jgi:undecaprenyl-diphosphatase
MALLASFERIYAGSHFPSDVLAGMAIGILCAYTTVVLFKNSKV